MLRAGTFPVWATVCLLAAGCDRLGFRSRAGGDGPAQKQPESIEVSASAAIAQTVPERLRATGSIAAVRSANVAPEVNGRIVETYVEPGDMVQSGTPLVRIQSDDAEQRLAQEQAAYNEAVANERFAMAEAERYRNLLKTGDVSRSEYERFKAQAEAAGAAVATARAAVAIAQRELRNAVVRSPFAGYVAARSVTAGEFVSTTTPVAAIVQLQPVKAQIQIPAFEAARLRQGLSLTLGTPSFPGEQFRGTITALNPNVNPESRAIVVESELPNPQFRLRPGMFVEAQILLDEQRRVVFVPEEAVVYDPDLDASRVFVVEDGAARVRVVEVDRRPGAARPGFVEVTSGLVGGEMVIRSNLDELYDGARVRRSHL